MWGLNPFFLGLFFTVLHLVFILFGVSDDRTVWSRFSTVFLLHVGPSGVLPNCVVRCLHDSGS